MPENNFENKVQQLMDAVKLRPSAEVWVQVEKRIREKKRRRFLFFLLPVTAGLLLVGGYYFWMNNASTAFKNSLSQKSPQLQKHAAPGKQAENNPSSAATPTGEIKTGTTILLPQQYAEKSSPRNHLNKKSQRNITGTVPVFNNRKNKNPTAKSFFADGPNELKTKKEVVNEPPATNRDVVIKDPERTGPVTSNATRVQDVKNNDSEVGAVGAGTKPIIIASQNKWRWGLYGAVGASGSTSKALPVFDENKSAQMSYNSPGNATSPPNRIITYPSQSKAALHFELGLFAQKPLSKKLTFTTGLQYHFASDHLNAGNRTDSTIQLQNFSPGRSYDNYYSRNNATYTNRYHFIEWPVGIDWQINKGKHLPVSWHNGFVIGLLAKTNGLVYDSTAGGIYYQDKGLFSKILFNAATGFSFHFNRQKKWQWSVGPDFRFSLNRLRTAEADRNKYLVAGAVHLNVLFPR